MTNLSKYILYLALLIPFAISCKPKNTKIQIDKIETSLFYKDYDIFFRKGIDMLDKNNLTLPFIQEYERNDSLIKLRIFTNDFRYYEYFALPVKDGYTLNSIFNPNECIGIDYATIDSGRIIIYNYKDLPYELIKNYKDEMCLRQIIPEYIKVISRDNITMIFFMDYLKDRFKCDPNECGKLEKMKDKFVLPFCAKIDLKAGFETFGKNLRLSKMEEVDSGYYENEYWMESENEEDSIPFNKGQIIFKFREFHKSYFKKFKPYYELIHWEPYM
jgi:hypothetical protein